MIRQLYSGCMTTNKHDEQRGDHHTLPHWSSPIQPNPNSQTTRATRRTLTRLTRLDTRDNLTRSVTLCTAQHPPLRSGGLKQGFLQVNRDVTDPHPLYPETTSFKGPAVAWLSCQSELMWPGGTQAGTFTGCWVPNWLALAVRLASLLTLAWQHAWQVI